MSEATTLPPPAANREETVDDAKARLMEAARAIDLLRPLREHPFLTVGVAATAGAVLGSSLKIVGNVSSLASTALRMVGPIAAIVGQFAAAKAAKDAAESAASVAAENDSPQPVTSTTGDI